ncbi:TPA: hypothetical protein DEX28_02600 [Patescibacteria group bacterium]|nr:MAG: hypothetical protein UW85_C0003G0013 [Parcubacteria group bacterium GW2011_GWA1_Parcubacteria_45_10]KKT88804.1 MAG: hypothetical protein UW89_C0004G0003 [Parcubacteria group bacterium GW2011_GWB1_45_10]HCI05615.1 hypothetical protein [Patescibacteria group bacterium]
MKISNNAIVIGLAAVLLGGLFYWQSKASPLPVNANNQQAQVVLDRFVVDLGEMKVDEVKTGEFILKNKGDGAVVLTNFETSCNCTYGRVVFGEAVSPTFNMRAHMAPGDFWWRQELNPGEEVKIQVIYKPSVMPVYGSVERSLLFKTSDPKMPSVELKVKAFVK